MYCPKCGKEIKNTDYNYCPYCGFQIEKLKQSFKEVEKSKDIKDNLNSWEKTMIVKLFETIHSNYDNYILLEKKYYIGFIDPKDRERDDFGVMFRFSKIDGKLVFKYRKEPSRFAEDNELVIKGESQINVLRNLCLTIIRNNNERQNTIKNVPNIKEQTTKPSVNKSSHKNIIVPGKYENELFDKNSGSDVEYYKKSWHK